MGFQQGDTISSSVLTAFPICAFHSADSEKEGMKGHGDYVTHFRYADGTVAVA